MFQYISYLKKASYSDVITQISLFPGVCALLRLRDASTLLQSMTHLYMMIMNTQGANNMFLFNDIFTNGKQTKETVKKSAPYSTEDVQGMYDKSASDVFNGWKDSYDQSPGLFFLVQKGLCLNNHGCKEMMSSYVRDLVIKMDKDREGLITIGMLTAENSGNDIKQASDLLSEKEKQFGFSQHNLKCVSVARSTKVVWLFTVSTEWISNPPVFSYFLGLIRSTLPGKDSSRSRIEDSHVNMLLCEHTLSAVFGKHIKRNWGVSTRGRHPQIAYSYTYGERKFSLELIEGLTETLMQRFPDSIVLSTC